MPRANITLRWAVAGTEPEDVTAVVNYRVRRDGGLKIYGIYLLAEDDRYSLGLDIVPYLSDRMLHAIGEQLIVQPS